jgi:uncharacterized protein YcfJ
MSRLLAITPEVSSMRSFVRSLHKSEEAHAELLPGTLLVVAGLIGLAIGAASDTGWLTIAGAAVAAVGYVAHDVTRHMRVDYNVFGRLEDLEGKKQA